ncbi:MAG: hypothetical protein QOE92_2055 [Chloroflexota bacterium]|jgi:hypothetical protein|nr:hypothetical protein [Chloroflexota bacterium]
MSETTTPGDAEPSDADAARGSYFWRLAFAVFGAMQADAGCLIGGLGFVILIFLSVIFAPQLTPCTSAGGIPCAP